MQTTWYLFPIYGLIWVGIFVYARRLSRHQTDMDQEVDSLADPAQRGDR